MKRYILAMFAILMMVGCGNDGPSDLCEGVVCENPWEACDPTDGVCKGNDPCLNETCSNHGTCDNSSGSKLCICNPEYQGANCDQCADGYHWSGDGLVCTDDPCDPNPCTEPNKTVCTNNSAAVCSCDPGYHDEEGACVEDQECLPNSCNNHGTCDDTGGIVTCSCDTGYIGDHCEACDETNGYHWNTDQTECTNDLCDPNPCSDDGNPCNGDEVCNPDNGQCEHENPINCPDDGDVCNGNEACDPTDGQCKSFNPLTCDDGLACTGEETCDPQNGCQPGITVDCNGHGSCVEPAGTCNCTDGWTGDKCEIPPAPTITAIPLECSATWCDALQIYQGTFTYTGPVTEITGTCSVTGNATPGTITDIIYSNGSGTYIYDPSPNGGGQIETIELGIVGLGGTDSSDFSHQLW